MRRKFTAILPYLGPAFIACVAYIDPGNFATNISAGSAYGYKLIWVIVIANLMAFLMQLLSAKLGLATGYSLAELSRIHFKKPVVIAMWIVAEIGAMATDLAEFLGASIALYLLFQIPLIWATLIVSIIVYFILTLDKYGYRPLEMVIGGLVGLIALAYVFETYYSRPDWVQISYHLVVPWISGKESLLLTVGIIGATVMPHAIYLHSSLTQNRIIATDDDHKRKIFRHSIPDCVIAMGLAGIVNIAMLYMSAATFHGIGKEVGDIFTAYKTLIPLLGWAAGTIFAVSLLLSGISSSVVGTMSGQVIMQGFVGFRIPVWVRRLVTMAPTLAIIISGFDPTRILVLSQVTLSFVLPIPIVTLIYFTSRRDIMGVLVNKMATTWLAWTSAGVIIILNLILVYFTFFPV